MTRNNGTLLKLALGFLAISIAAGISFWKLSAKNFYTGMLTGFAIALFGVLLYSLVVPQTAGEKGTFWLRYMGGAVLRYAVMIAVFCTAVFLGRIDPIGLLLGTFFGMMASTFIFLNKMRHTPLKPPEG